MRERLPGTRWLLVVAGAAAMGVAGTYQFVWSSISPALGTRLAAGEAGLGSVFTLYIVAQTLSQFPAGRYRDRHGPRAPMAVGAVLLTMGYGGTAVATELWQVALAYIVGGVGVGAVYTVAINTPVKWFTDRRGLATGIVTMAFGGVSVLFIPAVRDGLAANFTTTLLVTGGVAGGVALLAAAVVRDPPPESTTETAAVTSTDDVTTWRETIRTWQFWLLYLQMAVVNGVGLLFISNAVAFTEQFGLPATVATVAASAVALADSAGIVTIGGLSDRLGRERTVAVTVAVSGIALAGAVWAGTIGTGWLVVALLGAAAFFRSPVFSVVPALVGDYYGQARSSENYAVLYTAKVWGGIGGGVAGSALVASLGWSVTFLVGATALSGVGVLSLLLRPVD
jgi:OFA family oxalate/formate antiporter-like MFS transporter